MAYFVIFWKFYRIFKGERDLHSVARMTDWPNFDYSPAAQCHYIKKVIFLSEDLMS